MTKIGEKNMLKAHYRVKPELMFELEAKEQKDIFRQVAEIQEVFSEKCCGLCGDTNLKFTVRNVEDNEFYEMRCTKPGCFGKLAYGQNKKGGTIYPIRKLKNGVPAKTDDVEPFDFKTNGWHVYDKNKVAAAKKAVPPSRGK
jgi:hypothetical protein